MQARTGRQRHAGTRRSRCRRAGHRACPYARRLVSGCGDPAKGYRPANAVAVLVDLELDLDAAVLLAELRARSCSRRYTYRGRARLRPLPKDAGSSSSARPAADQSSADRAPSKSWSCFSPLREPRKTVVRVESLREGEHVRRVRRRCTACRTRQRRNAVRLASREPDAPVRRRIGRDVRVLVHGDPADEVGRVRHPGAERHRPGHDLLAVRHGTCPVGVMPPAPVDVWTARRTSLPSTSRRTPRSRWISMRRPGRCVAGLGFDARKSASCVSPVTVPVRLRSFQPWKARAPAR